MAVAMPGFLGIFFRFVPAASSQCSKKTYRQKSFYKDRLKFHDDSDF